MKRPFFSVVIPTLNEEKFLPRLLQSLRLQTTKQFEVIVVDGGSDDATVVRANVFAGKLPSLRVIKSPKANVSFQRNLGAKEATGEYLIFFDADVQVGHGFLAHVAAAIEKRKSLLLTNWMRPDSRDPGDQLMTVISNMLLEGAKLIDNPFAGGWDIVIERHVFERVGGFRTDITMSEDHELIQRCFRAGVVLTILKQPKIIYSLRRFRRYGYWIMLQRYAHAGVYGLLKKPITKAIFEYPMGGAVYKGTARAPAGGFAKFERTILKSIQKNVRKLVS